MKCRPRESQSLIKFNFRDKFFCMVADDQHLMKEKDEDDRKSMVTKSDHTLQIFITE